MKGTFFLITTSIVFTCLSYTISAQNTYNFENESIKNLLTKKREYNKRFDHGYKIQLYYGQENETRSQLTKFKENYPNVSAKLVYDKPYWKVLVGNYTTRLEADRFLNNIRENFSSAFILNLDK